MMARYSTKTAEMRCTYCGVKRPWDREHFPSRTYAICTWCLMDQHDSAGERTALRLFWACVIMLVVLFVGVLWWFT